MMTLDIVAPEKVGFSAERLARIRPVMQSYVDRGVIAGISTLIARKGEVVHFEQVGQMDKEAAKPMTADAIFRIYSMTKPVVYTALMTLYEQGKFQLFDPLAKYMPEFGAVKVLEVDGNGNQQQVPPARPIFVSDLFTHTAGFTYHFLDDSPVGRLYHQEGIGVAGTQTLEQMIKELARLPLAYHPGSRWHYSLGTDVAAYLIERLSGKPLADFLQETIFGPLGMADTAFFVPAEKQQRLASMYGLPDVVASGETVLSLFKLWQEGYNEKIDLTDTYPAEKTAAFARGGYGLFSTAQDYLRFTQMLLNQGKLDGTRIIGRKTAELMHNNHLPAELRPYELGGNYATGYGFGLGSRVLMDAAAARVSGTAGEFGWAGAAKTYYWVDPTEELIGIFMSQYLMGFDLPTMDFRVLAYSALVD